jgi:hypothetical protein
MGRKSRSRGREAIAVGVQEQLELKISLMMKELLMSSLPPTHLQNELLRVRIVL